MLEKNRWQEDIAIIPENPYVHKKMGDVYYAEGNYLAAIEEYKKTLPYPGSNYSSEIVLKYQKAILHHPQEIVIRLALVDFYLALEYYPEAVEELEEILEKNPAHPQALKILVNISIKNQTKAQIIPILEKAVEHALDDPTLIDMLVAFYMEKNQSSSILKIYQQQYKQRPEDLVLLEKIIDLSLQIQDYETSSEYLGKYLEKNPTRANEIAQKAEANLGQSKYHKKFYYVLAKAYLKQLKPEKAIIYYEKILQIYPDESSTIKKTVKDLLLTFPDFPEAQLLLANLYIKEKNYSEAVTLYNKVVRTNPNLYGEEVIRGYHEILRECNNQALATQSLGEIYLAKKEYPAAVEQFRILMEILPESTDFIIEKCKKIIKAKPLASARDLLGRAYIQQKNYDKAIEEAKYLIKHSPDYGGGYAIMGESLLAQGKADQSVEMLKTAIGLKPDAPHIQLIHQKAQQQRLEVQSKKIQEHLIHDPWKLSFHFMLGKNNFLLGNLSEAIPELQIALKDVSRAKDAYTLLGLAYKEQGRYDLAALQFQQAIAVAEKYIKREERLKLTLYQALAYEAFGLPDKAYEYYEKVAIEDSRFMNVATRVDLIKKIPEIEIRGKILIGIIASEDTQKINLSWVYNKEALDYLGNSSANPGAFSLDHNNHGVENALKGRAGEASKNFMAAVNLDKNLTAIFNNLALIYIQEKNYDQAELYINKALYLNPKLGVVYANLGLLFHLKGELDKAEKNYNEALTLDDNLQSLQINLGDLLYKKGRVEDAMIYWQRAMELSPLPELAQRRLMWKQV